VESLKNMSIHDRISINAPENGKKPQVSRLGQQFALASTGRFSDLLTIAGRMLPAECRGINQVMAFNLGIERPYAGAGAYVSADLPPISIGAAGIYSAAARQLHNTQWSNPVS
jgi:hypothetical protein